MQVKSNMVVNGTALCYDCSCLEKLNCMGMLRCITGRL